MDERKTIFDDDLHDLDKVKFIPWTELKNKTIFVTGATGLIGFELINVFNYINLKYGLNMNVLALVRNKEQAIERFRNILDCGMLKLIVGNVEKLPAIKEPIDYIIHGASQTASKEFVIHAVETLQTSVMGTRNLLELAKIKKVSSFVYLSSMEVYGYPPKGHKVAENEIGAFTPLSSRNSYPISKITAEAMCYAYSKEYGVPAKIIRLTQTFGPGVNYNDSRVFAYFAKCSKEKKNIVLKTKGETERSYFYTLDAATAILVVMLKGEAGQAYNAADESTYCSIAEMAKMIASDSEIQVEFDIQDNSANGFADTLYMDLDTSSLRKLGWAPTERKTLKQMYARLIDAWKNVHE